MNYNALFIRAVSLVQTHEGEQAAEKLFNVLFQQKAPAPVEITPFELHQELNKKVGFHVSLYDVRQVNWAVAAPFPGWSSAVPWIKECRTIMGCGLKEAKDIHDFVRDNPRVVDA